MTNEMKNVPELRFPGFSGDWDIRELKELGKYEKSYSFSRANEGLGNIRHIHYGDIHSKLPSKIEDINLLPRISKCNDSFEFVKNRDIVFADASEDYIDLGKTVLINLKEYENNVISGLHTHLFRPLEYVNSEFVLYFTKTIKYHKFIKRQGTGISVLGISKKNLEKLNLYLPSYKEQQKIGDFFSKLDRQIELEEQKLEKLEEQKKGYMQQIFSQELRFKDENGEKFSDWQTITLGQLSDIKTGSLDANAMVPNGKYKFFTCARETYQIDKYAFDTEALLISGNGANVGYIHYYKGKFNAYQRTYVLDNIQNDINFIKYYLERYLIKRIYSEKRDGNTPYITRSTLYDMSISIPLAKLEQNKIGNFFTKFDKLIEKQNQKIAGLKKRKQGFLQKMFV